METKYRLLFDDLLFGHLSLFILLRFLQIPAAFPLI